MFFPAKKVRAPSRSGVHKPKKRDARNNKHTHGLIADKDNAEKKLRNFDLNPRYGPYVGILRLDRWNRAKNFNLNPPIAIRNLISDDNNRKLRLFDLNPRFGPFAGIKRLDRWNRAEVFNLNPPAPILRLMEANPSVYDGVPKRHFPSLW